MYVGDDCPTQMRLPVDEKLVGEFARKLKGDRRTRAQRLAKIKNAVKARDYENPLKLSVAIDRLLDRLS